MTPRRKISLTLNLAPLTPLHVGDGMTYLPDSYVLHDKHLYLFDPAALLGEMNSTERESFRGADDLEMSSAERERFADDLKQIFAPLHDCARRLIESKPASGLFTAKIPLTGRAEGLLSSALHKAERQGAVRLFIRSGGIGNGPYLPGSSLKGAFRTALASAFLPRGASPRTHEEAMRAALGVKAGKPESDPLRFLSIGDAPLPREITVIDQAELFQPQRGGGRQRGRVQMVYERTLSLGEFLPCEPKMLNFSVRITLDTAAAEGPRSFDAEKLIGTLRDFHEKIFFEERERFFKNAEIDAIYTYYEKAKEKYREKTVLLRCGRFGHFESKSLEGVRRGVFPQRRSMKEGDPNEWGRSRTVIRCGKGDGKVLPFGWLTGRAEIET
jgi:CRISPR-associated protein Csm5